MLKQFYPALIAGCLLAIILWQNNQVVRFHFLFWEISASKILLFPPILLVGFLLGLWAGRYRR